MPESIENHTIRILLVADEAETARSTQQLLRQAGYTAALATTGAQVLEYVRSSHPDLVLLDRNLPDDDSLEICQKIKSDPALENVFVVIISPSPASKPEQTRESEGSADGYIARPIGEQELLARVTAYIRILKLSLKLRENNETLQKFAEAHHKAEAEAARLLEEAEQSRRALLRMAEEQAVAMESLRKSESRLCKLANTLTVESQRLQESQAVAKVGSWETNLATLEVTWTEETYRIFEVSPEKFQPTHQGFLGLVHPEDRAMVDAAFRSSQGKTEASAVEHRICLPGGRIKIVEERWQAVTDETGYPVRALGTCQDITARKLVEEVLLMRARQQQAVVRIGLEATGARALQRIFDFTTRMVAEALDVEMCKVLQLTPEGSHLRLVSGVGWRPGLVGVGMVGVDEASQAGFTLKSDGPIFVNDLRKEERFAAPPLLEQHDVISGLSVTISLLNKPWGVLGAHCRSVRNFDQQDAQFMQSVAALLSVVIERLAAQRSLSESEARMRSAQVLAPLGNWELEFAPNRLIWSDETYRIFGVTPESFAGTYEAFLGLVHPEDRQRMEAAHRQTLAGEGILEIDHRIIRPGGQIRHLRERGELIHDEHGRRVVLSGTVLDVTESVVAQETQRKAEELSTAIVASSLDAIITIDHEGDILEFNPSAEALFGWSKAAVLGRDLSDVIIPERLRDAHRSGVARYLATGEKRALDRRLELPAIRADGTEILIELNATRLVQSTPPQFTAFIRDITQSAKAQEILRTSEARFRAIFEQAAVGMCLASTGGEFLRTNRRFCEIVGYSNEELLARTCLETTHPDDRAREAEITERMLAGELPSDSWEKRYLHRDGRAVWCNLTLALIPGRAGEAQQFVGIIEDISQRKVAEERQNQNETMLRIAGSAAKLGGWSISLPDYKITWSDETAVIHDLPPGSSPSLEQALAFYPPEYRDGVSEHVRSLATDGTPFDFEHELITARQRRIWVRAVGEAQRDRAGQIVRLAGAFQDITERKVAELEIVRTNRALQLRSACSESLMRTENEADLLAAFCRHSREVGGYCLTWVGYAQEDAARTIAITACSGERDGYLDKVEVSWDETIPNGQGPAGRAIRSAQTVICADFETDDQFIPWRERALQHGLRSIICLPLRTGDHTFGLLALYTSEVNYPGTDELKLLQELAANLAFGIGNLRSRQQRQRMETAVMKVATSVSASVSEDFFLDLAVSVSEALQSQGAFVARLLPGEPAMVRTVAAVVDGEVVENFEYTLSGTPCESLMDGNECVIPTNVAGLFPNSPLLSALETQAYVGRRLVNAFGQTVGLICVLFREPSQDSGFVVSTLQIFATRAAAEFERLEADTRIREQAALLDKATDAIFVRDLEHRAVFWNRGAENLYGWASAEALGLPTPELLHPDSKKFHQAVDVLLEKGEWTGELEKKDRAGKSLTTECRWTLVSNARGVPESVLCIETDITERKKLEAQFLRAQRLESVGTLASGIAHDMNNILAPIMMSVELLKSDTEDEETLSLLDTLESCSQRGADLVRQILSFTRGVKSEQVTVDLKQLIRDLEKVMKELFPKDVAFDISYGSDSWMILGDPSQLHQVLMNLCVNARDAMPRGGTLTLAMENFVLDEIYAAMNPDGKIGAYVLISVTDTGIGVPPGALGKIFEPFFTTKELGQGTGLGLSTVIGIVKNHGGFVDVYSEEGKGTKFKVYLPAQTSETQLKEVPVTQSSIPRGNGELILLVDDEKGIREIALKTLTRFGYRVLEASNGAEAVALYVEHRKDIALVLTDVSMPIMDGVALVAALKSINPDARILVSSGLPISSVQAKAMETDIRQLVPKPYTAEKMLGIIHKVLHG